MFKKRVAIIVAAVLAILLVMFCFTACNPNTETGEKNITVYIGDKTFEVTTEQLYLHGVFQELLADGKISAYVYTESSYGASFTQVDVLTQDPTWTTPPFLSLWHNLNEFDLKSAYNEWSPSRSEAKDDNGMQFASYTHDGVLLYYSGVGIGFLPVKDGAVYAVFVD